MQFSWRVMGRVTCFAAVLVLLGTVTGCGGKGNVSGTVTGPDGQPLPAGRITFLPASGPPGVSADIQDGKYTAENVATGESKVSIDTSYIQVENLPIVKSSTQGTPMPGTGAGGPPPKDAPPAFAEMNKKREEGIKIAQEKLAKYRAIPEKFTDPKTSGLSVTVKSGSNTYPVDLSGKK